MSLDEDLKNICDDWLNIHRKTGYVPISLIQMRLINFEPGNLNTANKVTNFRKTFSEMVALNIKLCQFKNIFSSASIETKELVRISASEFINKKNETKSLSVSCLDNLFMELEKVLSDAQNAAQDMQYVNANDYPLRVCLLAKSLAFLVGFENPLPKNISTDNGFGLFLKKIFETVGEYHDFEKPNVVNSWQSFNKKWLF